jgi:hypothetical protein
MSTHTPWRERLLGSLMGQLQLATYLAVFLGFTGASTAGLWLSQRSQFLSGEAELTASASSLETCLLAHNLLTAREGEAASQVHEAKAREIRQELRDHSSVRTTLWIEQSSDAALGHGRESPTPGGKHPSDQCGRSGLCDPAASPVPIGIAALELC